jgi:tetratricopeptide (TPR) repeat protein
LGSLFLLIASVAGPSALARTAPIEPARSPVGVIIGKAQEALLEKDRRKASEILLEALQSNRPPAQKRQLKAKLKALSVVFLTDRAQSIAALAETLMSEKPREALEHFDEALRLEPDNVELLAGASRAALATGDCARANQSINQGLAVDPHSSDLKILSLYTKICQGTLTNLEQRLTARDLELDGVEAHLRPIQAKDLYDRKELKRLAAHLASWAGANRLQDPELHRWQWVHSVAIERPDAPSGQRYIQACQSLTPRRRQELRLNPRLCRDLDQVNREVEKHLASRPPEAAERNR